jgi:uncharacterized membrane protein
VKLLHEHISRDGFRLRGREMSRVDGFSDVVFGFAVTLLVVSLEVPKTYGELRGLMLGFVPFAISFLLLMLVWYAHFQFFRRYGLHDVGTIWLNGILLFFVLFYTYPLKFLFQALFNPALTASAHDARELTLLYSLGFAAIYAVIAALYWNAWRQREALELNALERRLTRLYMVDEGMLCVVALLACGIAVLLPAEKSSLATMAFMLIAVSKTVVGRRIGRARELAPAADSMKVDA